ncbi:MAG: LegC family aminotransferase [Bacteroidia bacterium]|nr:LegC family aminotransferase [Bacteroidia bacterium]MDW8346603.1 LegC family aminotransferase [Bacteroidia bacterium]
MIYLARPNLSGKEWEYVKKCLDENWISVAGEFIPQFEQKIAEYCQVKYAVATSSGTAALHIAMRVLNIGHQDAVIVPTLTFVASVNAICYVGASPVFIDVYPNTWQINTELIETYLLQHTYYKNGFFYDKDTHKCVKAILAVNTLGNIPDMIAIQRIANKFNLVLIEDAAEALGSCYYQDKAGSIGKVSILSFNGNKVITTGGGGMLLTQQKEISAHAKHLIHQAKVNGREYIHDEIGYNYRLLNILAAIGLAQMEQLPQFLNKKKEIHAFYQQNLVPLGFVPQKLTDGVSSNYWLSTFILPTEVNKQSLLDFLYQNGIEARSLWKPMHTLDMFCKSKYISHDNCAETIYSKAISLPSGTDISLKELQKVVDKIKEFVAKS